MSEFQLRFSENENGCFRILIIEKDKVHLFSRKFYIGSLHNKNIIWNNQSPAEDDKKFCDRILNLLVFA